MKAHKVELLVIDFDDVGDGIRDILEGTKYPNRCISPQVKRITTVDIGEWDDKHPLNLNSTADAAYERYFTE
jgi:hypothetical protein